MTLLKIQRQDNILSFQEFALFAQTGTLLTLK